MLSRKPDKPLIASFDFDQTATLPGTLNPNWAIISEMCRLKAQGWQVYIVTERNKNDSNLQVLKEFLQRTDPPVDEVFYTSGYEKYRFLPTIRATLHYDDDPSELSQLPEGITGVQVNPPALSHRHTS